MRAKIIILNSKDRKEILKTLCEDFGIEHLPEGAFFCLNKKEKVYFSTREVFDEDLEVLRVNTFGMYFGTYMKDGFRLSLEGLHLLQDQITKNMFELNIHQHDAWLMGEDLEIPKEEESRYVILKYKTDFIGVGRLKEDRILNYLPKSRKLKKVLHEE